MNPQDQTQELRGFLSALAVNDYHRASSISRDVDKAMKLIDQYANQRTLEVIGEDEPAIDWSSGVDLVRNELRAEQRKRLNLTKEIYEKYNG